MNHKHATVLLRYTTGQIGQHLITTSVHSYGSDYDSSLCWTGHKFYFIIAIEVNVVANICPLLWSFKWDNSEYYILWWISFAWYISISSLLFQVRKFQWRITVFVCVAYIYESHFFHSFSYYQNYSRILRITDIRPFLYSNSFVRIFLDSKRF